MGCPRGGSASWWPGTGLRARRRSSRGPGGRKPARRRSLGRPELIVALRKELAGQGLDAGPETICWHLGHHHQIRVSRVTVSRYLARAGLITPEPAKRPKGSYLRFEAEQPNECWQADFTHYRLADGTGTEVLTWLDDHSRLALSVTAHRRVTGPIVLAVFRAAVAAYGPPASTLTDNGMVFTTRFSGGRGGRNGLETELRHLGCASRRTASRTIPRPRGKWNGSSRR